jgi:hypothetical protein
VRLLTVHDNGDGSGGVPGTANSTGMSGQSNESDESRAQAQCVVALSIGTLRYMGPRLQGSKEERHRQRSNDTSSSTVMQPDSSTSATSSLRQELRSNAKGSR